jgi:hypothetical protein
VKQFVFKLTSFPPFWFNVDTALNPRQFSSWSLDKLQSIWVREIEMTHHSAVLVHPATSQDLI